MTNCPNCGAPITGLVCEYCDTVFSKQRSIDVRTLLELENRNLQRRTDIETLYEQAIFAMRAYSSGIFTYNEAREHVGLPKL